MGKKRTAEDRRRLAEQNGYNDNDTAVDDNHVPRNALDYTKGKYDVQMELWLEYKTTHSAASLSDLETLKHFAEFIASSTKGVLYPDGKPTVQTDFERFHGLSDRLIACFIADFLPTTGSHGTVGKISWIEPFTNLRGSALSHIEDLSESALAKVQMAKAIQWAREFLPALQGAHISSITSYWDGVTDTQDPIIARHHRLKNLICAAGGSFNHANDLPTIGGIIADVLSGLPISDRYSWNQKTTYSHRDQPFLVATSDFVAMEEQAERSMQSLPVDQSGLAVI